MINVLHINTRDAKSGAAISAFRLHKAILKSGHNSMFMVGQSTLGTKDSYLVPGDWKTPFLHRIVPLTGLNYLEYTGSSKIFDTAPYKSADVLNFHNLHRDFFSYLAIPRLTKTKPAVWTLHDMWSFTGHCAYSFDCKRWMQGCGHCPYLSTYPAVTRDATKWEWKIKNYIYSRSNITIVVTSRWLEKQAKRSMLTAHFNIKRIPHGVCTDTYKPKDIQLCRTALGIPDGKRALLFVAVELRDYRKGSDLLFAALKSLPDTLKSQLVLMVMGEGGRSYSSMSGIETIPLGYVGGDQLKVICYCAADVVLFPSRADIWSLVVQEAMACGTPSVAFDVGGVPDLVRENFTGLLAPPEDHDAFKDAIVELLEDDSLYSKISQNCRDIAISEYSIETQHSHYIALYKSLLKEQK